jgi:predicted nucleic acid-binding protein
MKTVVVDCSAIAASLLSEREGAAVDALLDDAIGGKVALVVPALFWFEIQNVLVLAERAGRIPKGDAARLESLLLALPIQTEAAPNRVTLPRIRRWAETHRLTAYDAAYPELAERLGARLKTLDAALLRLSRSHPWIE